MASTYVNDLRLNEMATGDASGSWGTITNTNLELIGEAFGYGTESIGNADTTITMADGASDAARSFYLKITSSADLTTTRVITLAPNTVSKVWMIENATSGSQIITIKQGTGATINIPNGHVKMVATDGAGSGGAVLDLLTDLNVATNLFVKNAGTGDGSTANIYLQTAEADIAADDVIGKINFQAPNEGTGTDAILVSAAIQAISEGDFSSSSNATSLNFMTGASEAAATKMTLTSGGNLKLITDTAVLGFGAGNDVTLTHVHDTGLLLNSTMALQFNDASQFINAPSATVLDINATDEIELNATLVDLNGNLDVSGTALVTGVLTTTATTVFNGGFAANDGSTITTADNTTQLTLASTDADANVGPVLDLYRNSASPADNDILGKIEFHGEDSAGNKDSYASFTAYATDVTSGSEDTTFYMNTKVAGANTNRINLTPSEIVINEESKDLNFRVESNGATYALFVDGGANHVNVMTSSDLGRVFNVSGDAVIQKASSGATATGGSVLVLEDDDNAELSILGGSSSLLAINFGHSGDADDGMITYNTTSGSEMMGFNVEGGVVAMNLTAGATVFNEGSVDMDFRVESNGSQKMLFVDGGNNGVLIDSSGADLRPYTTLDVTGQSNTEMMIHNDTDGAGEHAALLFKSDSQNESGGARSRTKAGIFFVRDDPGTRGTGKLHIAVDGGNDDTNVAVTDAKITIDATGAVTMANGLTLTDGNLVVANGHGIDFSAQSANAGATAELLDHYEEGTWTPTIASDAAAAAYTTQVGFYTRIGSIVHISATLQISDLGSFAGAVINLAGLPFIVSDATNYNPIGSLVLSGTATAKSDIFLRFTLDTIFARLEQANGQTTHDNNMNANAFDTGTILKMSGSYIVK